MCVSVCVCERHWCGSRAVDLFFLGEGEVMRRGGLELGAPNSEAAKGRSPAVPVNDV